MENSKAYKKKKTCCFNCSSLRGSSLTSQLGRVVLKYILFVFIFFHHVILLFFVKIWYFGHQRYQLFNANSIKYYNFATDWYIGKSHWYLWCHWDLPPPTPLGGNLRSLLKATAAPSILLLFSATLWKKVTVEFSERLQRHLATIFCPDVLLAQTIFKAIPLFPWLV